jgi:hypothetical protein
MKVKYLLIFLYITSSSAIYAQDTLLVRKYKFGYYNQLDLRNSSTNAISTNRVLQDAFRKGIKPSMNDKLGNVAYGFFTFSTTFLTMLWSHEFGHSLRAQQVGGQFKIHNMAFPIPYTTMHLPESISLFDEALSVTGGFEVNSLNIRAIQHDFISSNGICNEDLGFSFANRIMYPLYTSVILPINPSEKDVWINTAGDPVHIALPVFKNYSNNQVFLADSTVNPKLVKYYNQSALFAVFINLVDPQFYKEVGASFGKNKIRKPTFIIGDYNNGWTYSTMFNTSPLGYELYFNNYIHLKNQKFSLYYKYGNPFKNNGIGVAWTDFISLKNINVSANIDFWDQDLFDMGVSSEVSANWKFSNHLGIFINTGYKTKGYVLGKQIDEGLNLGFGLQYYTHY